MNDSCANAVPLSDGAPATVDLRGALIAATPTPVCQAYMRHDVWFTYAVPGSGVVTVNTCGSDFDTVLQVYSGTCGTLVPVACGDMTDLPCWGLLASAQFTNVAGTTYYIQAGGYLNNLGTLQITATLDAPPMLNWAISGALLWLQWEPGNTLQTSTNLGPGAVWDDLSTSGNYFDQYEGNRFFRVKR